jgi:phage shock protein A
MLSMLKLLKKYWNYVTAALTGKFNEKADPKVQLEQALLEAQEQHRRLTQQAANVIANQKQSDMQLNRKLEELEKVNNSARQAVVMADEAAKKGDVTKAGEYTRTAETFANRLIALETEVQGLKTLSLQATQASDQAKSAVAQSSTQLQKKLSDKQKLLSQLDQAKMQEQLNKTMGQLSATVGDDVPTLDEVQKKIEERYAKAMGSAELQGSSVEARMLEVEQASLNTEAQARLSQIKAQLGLGDTPAAVVAPAAPEATPQPGA